MYYAIYDNQLRKFRSFGFNSKDLLTIREELINYLLLGNFSVEGENSIKNNTLEELCNYYEFSVIKSNQKINEDSEPDVYPVQINELIEDN